MPGAAGEAQTVMAVSRELRRMLMAKGVIVHMTHEKSDSSETLSEDSDSDNVARALMANRTRSELFIRLHADASTGRSAIYFPEKHPNRTIARESGRAAEIIWSYYLPIIEQSKVVFSRQVLTDEETKIGHEQGGLLTGSRASLVPVVLVELVPMNATGSTWINDSVNRKKAAMALADGIVDYLNDGAYDRI